MSKMNEMKVSPDQFLLTKKYQKNWDTLLDLSVSSLRRGHANLLCIVPILADDPRGVPIYSRARTT